MKTKLLSSLLLTTSLADVSAAQNNQKFIQPGFNAVEASYRADKTTGTQGVANIRLYGDVAFHASKADIGLSAFDYFDVNKPASFFGRNLLLAGKTDGDSAVLEAVTTANGTIWRTGIRDQHLAHISKKTYGWADLTFGKNDASLTVLEGVQLPKGFRLEVYEIPNKSYHGAWDLYSQMQPLYRLPRGIAGGRLDAYLMWQNGAKSRFNSFLSGIRWTH